MNELLTAKQRAMIKKYSLEEYFERSGEIYLRALSAMQRSFIDNIGFTVSNETLVEITATVMSYDSKLIELFQKKGVKSGSEKEYLKDTFARFIVEKYLKSEHNIKASPDTLDKISDDLCNMAKDTFGVSINKEVIRPEMRTITIIELIKRSDVNKDKLLNALEIKSFRSLRKVAQSLIFASIGILLFNINAYSNQNNDTLFYGFVIIFIIFVIFLALCIYCFKNV